MATAVKVPRTRKTKPDIRKTNQTRGKVVKPLTPRKHTVIILAHDPGVVNYGYCVLKVEYFTGRPNKVLSRYEVLEVGKFKNTYTNLKGNKPLKEETENFLNQLLDVLERNEVQIQIAERFMMRRAGGALTIELINQMVGSIRVVANTYAVPLKIVPSSQWKNPIKRLGIELPELYKFAKPVSNHEYDAAMIAIFGVYSLAGGKPFSDLNPKKFLMSLAERLHRKKIIQLGREDDS